MNTLRYLLLIVLCAGCATYQTRKSAVNVYGGVRSLENSDWDEVDDATVWGAEGLLGLNNNGLGLEGGYSHAKQDGGPLFSGTGSSNVDTDELYLGLRETWNTDSTFQPYIGAGGAWLDANADSSSGFNDDDNSTAAYAHAGLGWQFQHIQVGVDGRILLGSNLEFDNQDSDLDYLQGVVFIGWSF